MASGTAPSPASRGMGKAHGDRMASGEGGRAPTTGAVAAAAAAVGDGDDTTANTAADNNTANTTTGGSTIRNADTAAAP